MRIRADAESGNDPDAERRRSLGRNRRADDLRRRARGAERLYRATGKRFRSVPLKNHDIQMV
jgi:hypothetical protein